MQEEKNHDNIISPSKEPKEIPLKNSKGDFDISQVDPIAAAMFSYLLPLIGGVIFFFSDKKDKFVKFHAFQSILFWLLVIGTNIVANTIFGIFARLHILLVSSLVAIALSLLAIPIFGVWLFIMWKAYSKEEYELPYIGRIAKQQAEKPEN